MTDVLEARIRRELGSGAANRVRRAGCVPAVLYAHGQENMNLALPADKLNAAIRHGSKMVDLKGDVDESALISDVQWDTFGVDVLHVDLTRVTGAEKVRVVVPLELRGEAPGARAGGRVEHTTHEVRIECPASSIPDKIEVSINALEIDRSLKMGDIGLPGGAALLSAPDEVVVQCSAPMETAEKEERAAAEGGEPEVIGREAGDEEAEGES